ncbi:MAG: hypothetical protein R3C56_19175 [Pirellulaceae bacterium]
MVFIYSGDCENTASDASPCFAGREAGKPASDDQTDEQKLLKLQLVLTANLISIRSSRRTNEIKDKSHGFGHRLSAILDDLTSMHTDFDGDLLSQVIHAVESAVKSQWYQFPDRATGGTVSSYHAFSINQIETIEFEIEKVLESIGGIVLQSGPDEAPPCFTRERCWRIALSFLPHTKDRSIR